MEIPRLSDLRPRTVWDIVDDAFDLYRSRFALFAGIAAVVSVPASLLVMGWLASVVAVAAARPGDPSLFFSLFGAGALSLPLYGFAYVLSGGAAAVAVEDCLNRRPTGVGLAYRRALRRFWPLIASSFLVGFLYLAGLCAMYVGIFVAMAFAAFVSQAVVLENRGVTGAISRSFHLAAGHFWRVLGMMCLLALITGMLSGGLSAVIQVAALFLPKMSDVAAQQVRDYVISQVTQSLASILLAPLSPIATTLMYYDLRVRREGLDIEAEAEALGVTLAPDPFGGAARPRASAP